MIKATYFRPRETWLDWVVKCPAHDITIPFRGGVRISGRIILARMLKERGISDNEVLLFDEVGCKPEYAIRSETTVGQMVAFGTEQEAYASAQENTQSGGLSAVSYEAIGKLIEDTSVWSSLSARLRGYLRTSDFVEVNGDQITVTDEGRAAHDAYTGDDEILINPIQREALALCPVSVEVWDEKIHVRTRRALLDRGWVTIMDGVVNARSEDEIKALPSSAPKPMQTGPISDTQRAAMKLCPMPEEEWNERVGGKTRTFLFGKGWASVDSMGIVRALKEKVILERIAAEKQRISEPAQKKNPAWVKLLTTIKKGVPGKSSDHDAPVSLPSVRSAVRRKTKGAGRPVTKAPEAPKSWWESQDGRVTAALLRNGLVKMDAFRPVLTAEGEKYIAS